MVVLFLALIFYFIKSSMFNPIQRSVLIPVATMILLFFLLNKNFYQQLLKYQGGNQLAFKTEGKVDPNEVYFWKQTQSSSFNFYSGSLRKQFNDSLLSSKENVWLLYDIRDEADISQQYKIGQRYETVDYEITKIDVKFINPDTRDKQLTKMVLARVTKM